MLSIIEGKSLTSNSRVHVNGTSELTMKSIETKYDTFTTYVCRTLTICTPFVSKKQDLTQYVSYFFTLHTINNSVSTSSVLYTYNNYSKYVITVYN